MIELHAAGPQDLPALLELQRCAFAALLEKYRDYETNPAAESPEMLEWKLTNGDRDYYFIREDGEDVGLICVKRREGHLEVSPIGLLPELQGQGKGREAMRLAEGLYPDARHWELGTILEETGLCRFYESLGYVKSGRLTPVKDGMTIVGYKKLRES